MYKYFSQNKNIIWGKIWVAGHLTSTYSITVFSPGGAWALKGERTSDQLGLESGRGKRSPDSSLPLLASQCDWDQQPHRACWQCRTAPGEWSGGSSSAAGTWAVRSHQQLPALQLCYYSAQGIEWWMIMNFLCAVCWQEEAPLVLVCFYNARAKPGGRTPYSWLVGMIVVVCERSWTNDNEDFARVTADG